MTSTLSRPTKDFDDQLTLDVTAKTYRYLDETGTETK